MAGVLFARIRRTRWQFLAATTTQTIFIACMASVDQNTPRRAVAFVIIAAFGVGASQILGILIIQFGAGDDHIGVATGLVQSKCLPQTLTYVFFNRLTGSVRATGGAIAIAIYGSIINDKVKADIGPKVAAAVVGAGLSPTAVLPFISI